MLNRIFRSNKLRIFPSPAAQKTRSDLSRKERFFTFLYERARCEKKRFFTFAVLSLILIIVFTLLYFYFHNFYTVIPGEVYRSRELNAKEFGQAIEDYHLHSIINLRGYHPEMPWYVAEISATHAHHLAHYDIALKSKVFPSLATLKFLVRSIDSAPKPLLIHCESGVDRTGLAAVVALLLNNATLDEAQKQVSYRYFVTSSQSVGVQLVQKYGAWLQEHHFSSTRENFLQWVNRDELLSP